MNDDNRAKAIEVRYSLLQPATLRALVEEFVTRDTTDYGERERTLEEKVKDVCGSSGAARRRCCSTPRRPR